MQYSMAENYRSRHGLMNFYTLDPLRDERWDALTASHPRASVFHEKGWLRSLAKTYGYRPLALTSTSGTGPLADGMVFCEVASWITGTRLVSLPFSDHAEPLLNDVSGQLRLKQWACEACEQNKWKYVELRPMSWEADHGSSLVPSQSFWLHSLDLSPALAVLSRNLHKDCVLRRVRHAEKERLTYERGGSNRLLCAFYRLLTITRRRHHLLPQPRDWFSNLMAEMNPRPEIRLASKDGIPLAAIFTLRHGSTVVYKYGCSDERFHHLGGMPFLFWNLIEESKYEGVDRIDLGRTDLENKGLMEFKDRLGASRRRIDYLRYSQAQSKYWMELSHLAPLRGLFSLLPDELSSPMGRLVYRHFG